MNTSDPLVPRMSNGEQMPALQWLDKLPDDYRERALYNLGLVPKFKHFDCQDMATALHSFSWRDTPEGYDFWSEVWRYYDAHLPPIPDNHPSLSSLINLQHDGRRTTASNGAKRTRSTTRHPAESA